MAWVLFAQQNPTKTAIQNSRINFYFVTCFYSLYDICMARQMIKTTIEKTGFALKQIQRIACISQVFWRILRKGCAYDGLNLTLPLTLLKNSDMCNFLLIFINLN